MAAVGADSPDKQELDPALMAAGVVVADVLEQCASIGDLHHALEAGAVTREETSTPSSPTSSSGRRPGRRSPEEITIFDSTGTAIKDVAAAALVYERAVAEGAGLASRWGSERLPGPCPAARERRHAGRCAPAAYFLRLGATGFGGPVALVGYMQRDLVEERRWFTPEEYREGLALAQLAPGPLAAQLAMYLGWVRGGARARPSSASRSSCRPS